MNTKPLFRITSIAALTLSLAACDFDVANLNSLDLEEFEQNPTPATLAEAEVGLMAGYRAGKAASNGLVSMLGILGRESYNFDPADPRFITEMLEASELDGGSPAFGGNFWVGPYRNIRNTYLIENGLPEVAGISDEEKSAARGFARTVRALEFITIVTTRWERDVPIAVDRGINDDLAPLEPRATVLQHIADTLDEARTDLEQGGTSFPFNLSSGFAGFDDPASFLMFNRAIRARVAAYQQDWQGVLDAVAESFISESPSELDVGVYHVFSTGAGDLLNDLSSEVLYVHPSVQANAQLKPDGELDDRVTRKIVQVEPASVGGSAGMYTSSQRFTAYMSNTAPVPIIRNEELLLLRAEGNIGLGDYAAALPDINLVRTASGGLAPLAMLDAGNAVDELLYQRYVSLLFEGGHRWIDMRRYDRLSDLANDDENQGLSVHSTYPLPVDEQAARGLIE